MNYGAQTLGKYIRPYGATEIWDRLQIGWLIFYKHTVWKVDDLVDLPIEGNDHEVWTREGQPDAETWPNRPYRAHLTYLGGARPRHAEDGDDVLGGTLIVPASIVRRSWYVYPGGRWPACSCCLEPAPCRAEMEDRQVEQDMRNLGKYAGRLPGACWACEEPITKRQVSVIYTGINLDYPLGPQVMFHTRAKCEHAARRYEERWLAADPDRPRILTYPYCPGRLYVHQDGSSECVSWTRSGEPVESADGCQGYSTHDHGSRAACYLRSHGCPQGCTSNGHPGARPGDRQPRRHARRH